MIINKNPENLPKTRQMLNFIGGNPIASVNDDTVENWIALGTGVAYIKTSGLIKDQPAQYGFIQNYISDTGNIFQIWNRLSASNTEQYIRGGNSSGWYNDGAWVKCLNENNGTQIKLLWTNASISSTFSPQTISLDLSGYDAVIVRCTYAKGYTPANEEFIPINESSYVINSGAFNSVRLVSPTATGVGFANGYYYKSVGASATVDDGRMIPYQIFGVKGVQ